MDHDRRRSDRARRRAVADFWRGFRSRYRDYRCHHRRARGAALSVGGAHAFWSLGIFALCLWVLHGLVVCGTGRGRAAVDAYRRGQCRPGGRDRSPEPQPGLPLPQGPLGRGRRYLVVAVGPPTGVGWHRTANAGWFGSAASGDGDRTRSWERLLVMCVDVTQLVRSRAVVACRHVAAARGARLKVGPAAPALDVPSREPTLDTDACRSVGLQTGRATGRGRCPPTDVADELVTVEALTLHPDRMMELLRADVSSGSTPRRDAHTVELLIGGAKLDRGESRTVENSHFDSHMS